MLQKMKDLGLRGPKNGHQTDGSQRYRSFKTQALNRTKFLTSPPLWMETDSIKVPKITEADLVKDLGQVARTQKKNSGNIMAKHLAGIIPLANFDDNYKLPYDSFMLPIKTTSLLSRSLCLSVPWLVVLRSGS